MRKKKKLSFPFHLLLIFSLCISHNFLLLSIFFYSLLLALIFFFSRLLALTHAVLQDYNGLNLTDWDFPSLFSSAPNGRMAFLLFLHLFLLFFLSYSWYQFTINATYLPWLLYITKMTSTVQLLFLASFFSKFTLTFRLLYTMKKN